MHDNCCSTLKNFTPYAKLLSLLICKRIYKKWLIFSLSLEPKVCEDRVGSQEGYVRPFH